MRLSPGIVELLREIKNAIDEILVELLRTAIMLKKAGICSAIMFPIIKLAGVAVKINLLLERRK